MLEKLIADLVFEMRELNRNLASLRLEKPQVVADAAQLALPIEEPPVEAEEPSVEVEVEVEESPVEVEVEESPVKAEEPPAPPAPAEPKYTFADVRNAMVDFLKLRGPVEMAAMLTKFGCGSVRPNANNMKPEQYASFLAAVKLATEN